MVRTPDLGENEPYFAINQTEFCSKTNHFEGESLELTLDIDAILLLAE
jgi:hypothetical protein